MVFYVYIYSHILVTVVKEFIKIDQQIKTSLYNSLQEQIYLSYLFFLIVLETKIILVRSVGKLNLQFNLKRKFSASSDSKKTQFLKFIAQTVSSYWTISDYILVIFNKHKFRHNFRTTVDPMCSCDLEPETTLCYLLRCNLYSDLTTELLNGIFALNPTLKNLSHEKLLNILLYGLEDLSFKTNKTIIKSTIKFF